MSSTFILMRCNPSVEGDAAMLSYKTGWSDRSAKRLVGVHRDNLVGVEFGASYRYRGVGNTVAVLGSDRGREAEGANVMFGCILIQAYK